MAEESPVKPTARVPSWIPALLGAALVLVLTLLLLGRAMERDLNHDEHQFIAPGILMAREGLQPYGEFAIFHVPNMILLYGALDRLFGSPIASMKAFASLSSAAMLALTLVAVWRARRQQSAWWALGFGTLLCLAVMLDPLFLFTNGKTWNHEWPALLIIMAAGLQLLSLRCCRGGAALLSGLCLGLAAGSRLTHITLAGAAALTYLLVLRTWRERLTLLAWWGGGLLLGLSPTLYYALKYPAEFRFDNLEFPRLRSLDPDDDRVRKTMTLGRKFRFLFKEVLLPSWPLVVLYGASAGPWLWQAVRERRRPAARVLLPALLLVCAIAGCFAPSRYQYQHFFLLIPILVLGIALSFALGPAGGRRRGVLIGATWVVLLLSTFLPKLITGSSEENLGWVAYKETLEKTDRGTWFVARMERAYARLPENLPHGARILTLAPAQPLQLGYRIYPELATGPFAWRLADLVPAEKRKAMHLLAPEDLTAYLADAPPDGIVIGHEPLKYEQPFLNYAKAHHYREVKMSKGKWLWVKPQ